MVGVQAAESIEEARKLLRLRVTDVHERGKEK